MIFKKIHFPIFIVIAICLFNACAKKVQEKNKKYSYFLAKADSLKANQNFDKAFYYYNQAKLSCSEDEKARKVYALYFMAQIQQLTCDFSGSEATATEALRIYPDCENIVSIHTLLGLSYQEQFDFENANKYYNLGLAKTRKEIEKCVLKNNIGYALLESKKYQEAKEVFNKIIYNDSLIVDKPNYAKVLDNLGFAYFKLNNPKAIGFLSKALKIRDSINNNSELVASYMHFSEYYQNLNLKLSNDFAQKAYNAATATNSPDDRIEAIKFLIASSKDNKVKSLALQQMSISDSISRIRQNSKIQFAKIKFDTTIAQKESEKQKSQKQLYLSLFLFVTTLSIVIFFAVRIRNKRKLQKATYDTETRIAKKLHDELANDVFNAMTYADTQDLQNPSNKEFLIENLDKIYTQARNISKENSQIDTSDTFEAVLKAMLSTFNSNKINVILKNNSSATDWLKLPKEAKIVIYRTLQELMVNMKKHSQCSLVVIAFESRKNSIEINYSDNGIGCPEMLNFKKGLQNAENRILSIKGTITFDTETNKGFKAKIKIPK